MEIILYKSSSDPRRIDKTNFLTQLADITDAKIYFPLNILSPEFSIKYNSTVVSANYCYIPELSRYYFLSEPVLDSGKVVNFKGEVDVLMSYSTEILNLDCICERCQTKFNKYIKDDIPSSVKADIINYRFSEFAFYYPASPDDYHYILTLNGLVGEA